MEPSRPIWRRRSERRYSGGGPASIDQHNPVRVYLGGRRIDPVVAARRLGAHGSADARRQGIHFHQETRTNDQ